MHLFVLEIIICWILVFPTSLRAASDYSYNPEVSENTSELTFENIQTELLAKKSIRSIEEFLKWLSEKQSELLENYTLMHTSASLQGSSYSNPRAILFGKTGRLIITFNGEPSQNGYYSLELMQFRSRASVFGSKSHFEFREINFPKNSSENIQISEANPPKCMRCHTTDLKPIWDPYEIWEGAYGKRDDAIIDFDNDKYAPLGQENDLIKEHRDELQKFKSYQEKSKTHSRYQFLKTKEGSPVAPYSPKIRGTDGFRPNLRLTGLLTRLQVERIADQMLETKEKQELAQLFLAEALGCSIENESGEKIQKNRAFSLSVVEKNFSEYTAVAWSRFRNEPTQRAMSVALFLLGWEPSSFNLSKNPSYWQYFEGGFFLEELLVNRLYAELAKLKQVELPSFEWPSFYNYSTKFTGNYEDQEGQELRFLTACRKLTPEIKDVRIENEKRNFPPTALKMCLSCHGAGVEGPKIDFLNLKKKAEILRRIDPLTEASQSMPPGRRLGYKERVEIIDYLSMLETSQK